MPSLSSQPVLGIVGAGQLARMMLPAAVALDLRVRLLAARADDGAARVWPEVAVGSPDSLAALQSFAAGCDILTFDHELVDPAHLVELERQGRCLRPSAAAQLYAQEKAYQRSAFAAAGLPAPPHAVVRQTAELDMFAAGHGWPVVLKARRGGYDGRGVWVVGSTAEAESLLARAGGDGLLAERWLPIERELAVLLARRPGGETVVYPVVETVQVDGICHEVHAPAPLDRLLADQAERLARRVAEISGVVGMLAVELFLVRGALVVNEIAVRPHNSGHFSIEGAETSQFENHLRAVLDLPLGGAGLTAPCVTMVNVFGGPSGADPSTRLGAALAEPGVHVHLYGKEARPGRKLGHVTAPGVDPVETRERARRAAALLEGGE